MKKTAIIFILFLFLFIQGCANKVHFTSSPENATMRIDKTSISGTTPLTGSLGRTTFGSYHVRVTKEGFDPLYGRLPLTVSPGTIVLDILFFAPALFFNIQSGLPYYKFDLEEGVIKYRKTQHEAWQAYNIPEQESDEIKKHWFNPTRF